MKGKAGGRPRDSAGCACDVIFSLQNPPVYRTNRCNSTSKQKTRHSFNVQHILLEHLILLEIIEPITAIEAELLCYVPICVLCAFVGVLSPNA
jgi:hypothetical protein